VSVRRLGAAAQLWWCKMRGADLLLRRLVRSVASGLHIATAKCLILSAALVITHGCTVVVRPPIDPVDPVEVFVLSEALHTGIVLPPDPSASGDSGEYVEFGFGDWGWYALGKDSWYNAFATMLWPTQGALGRRTFGAKTPDELRRRVPWAEMVSFHVSREKAAALRILLQAQFDRARKLVVVRNDFGFKFVPIDASYWLLHNCADLGVDWLRSLGCEIGWQPVRLKFSVVDPVSR
jgi:hypothetical protein